MDDDRQAPNLADTCMHTGLTELTSHCEKGGVEGLIFLFFSLGMFKEKEG
jgi:hypothetical protein